MFIVREQNELGGQSGLGGGVIGRCVDPQQTKTQSSEAGLGCILMARRYPAIALFSLIAIVIPFFSGVPQNMARYVLAAPMMFIKLSRWGRRSAFDRAWPLASVLLLGMLTTLFAYDMWVA